MACVWIRRLPVNIIHCSNTRFIQNVIHDPNIFTDEDQLTNCQADSQFTTFLLFNTIRIHQNVFDIANFYNLLLIGNDRKAWYQMETKFYNTMKCLHAKQNIKSTHKQKHYPNPNPHILLNLKPNLTLTLLF